MNAVGRRIAGVIEVACDESGAEGEKLIGGNTDVFCHAGVALSGEEASACVRELRRMIRSPAVEYKAEHLLREKNRRALVWFLGPDGPIDHRANAFLVDKKYALLLAFARRMAGTPTLAGHPAVRDLGVEGMAAALYRASRSGSGLTGWYRLLSLLNELMWSTRRPDPADVDSFGELVRTMRTHRTTADAAAVLDLLGGPVLRAVFRPDSGAAVSMDPLVPAILRAVDYWGPGVSIVHDRHVALTEARIAGIMRARPSTTLRVVSSRSDPRVQVADFLAGVARRLASDELAGAGDPELTGLLRGYVDPCSTWGDTRIVSRGAKDSLDRRVP